MVRYKLSTSGGKEVYTLLDDDVAALLNNRSVRLRSDGYAVIRYRQGRIDGKRIRKQMYIHTFVMEITNPGSTVGMTVDHLNNDKLDNRRENLEVVTAKENLRRAGAKRWKKRRLVK